MQTLPAKDVAPWQVEWCHCMYHCKCFDRPSNKRVQGSRKDDSEKLIELKSAARGTNGSNHKGAYSVAEYVEKCLRDIGIEEVSERTGLFLCHEIDSK